MGISVDDKIEVGATPYVRELIYTICPVLVASNVALELGWIDDELARVGAKATYLRSEASNVPWQVHYTHDSDSLIRDGGNSPAIQAKADIHDTVLLAVTQAQPGGKIIVRADADIYRVADLRGRKVALYKSAQTGKIDHRRSTSDRGIRIALAVNGLSLNDVEIVDIEDQDAHTEKKSRTPAGIWAQRHVGETAVAEGVYSREARALAEGRVDAIFDYSIGVSKRLEATGLFKVIEDLDRHPDWTLHIANSPRTLAVSREFADRNRDVVVAWLRAAVRAGRWVNANREAAADIFLRTTNYLGTSEIARALHRYDLVPGLSAQNLAGLTIEKNFLRDHGYIRNDFDVNAWADGSYLEEALASLKSS